MPRSSTYAIFVLSYAALLTTACAVNEAILAESGVTWCSSSTGELDSRTGTSTSTSNDTSAADGTIGLDTSTSSDETCGTGGTSSTGPEPPICGDGVVEGDETCDDGNQTPGDGCQECAKDSIVFVTSEVYQRFALGGLYGADQRCRSLAARAQLANFLSFKAWLSTPTMSAAERLVHSRGRYVLVNGLVVAQSWDAMIWHDAQASVVCLALTARTRSRTRPDPRSAAASSR